VSGGELASWRGRIDQLVGKDSPVGGGEMVVFIAFLYGSRSRGPSSIPYLIRRLPGAELGAGDLFPPGAAVLRGAAPRVLGGMSPRALGVAPRRDSPVGGGN
jgi:hypothetical protein